MLLSLEANQFRLYQRSNSYYKYKKPVKAFKPTSANYDARILAFREKDWSVSLLRGSDELSCAINPGLLKHS